MLGLVLVSFAAGWWVRGGQGRVSRRHAPPPGEELLRDALNQLGRTRRAALALLSVAAVEADEGRPGVRAAGAALEGHLRRLTGVSVSIAAVYGDEHPAPRQLAVVQQAVGSLCSMAGSNPREVRADRCATSEAIAAAEAGLQTALIMGWSRAIAASQPPRRSSSSS